MNKPDYAKAARYLQSAKTDLRLVLDALNFEVESATSEEQILVGITHTIAMLERDYLSRSPHLKTPIANTTESADTLSARLRVNL